MVLYHGILVGNSAQVVRSSDSSLVGRSGSVVEETKNTITLLTQNGSCIKIAKSVIVLKMNGGTQNERLLEGSQIIGTPADRIKS